MIKPNKTSNRSREEGLLKMVAGCDAEDCTATITLRPRDETQALDLATGGVITPWLVSWLDRRDWISEGTRTYCPSHRLLAADSEEIIDPFDQAREFMEEKVEPAEDHFSVSFSDLYDNYRQWCVINDKYPLGRNTFGRAVRDEGYLTKTKSRWNPDRQTSESKYMVVGVKVSGLADQANWTGTAGSEEVKAFLDTQTVRDVSGKETLVDDMFEQYDRWAREEKGFIPTRRGFTKGLREQGVKTRRKSRMVNGIQYKDLAVRGIALIHEPPKVLGPLDKEIARLQIEALELRESLTLLNQLLRGEKKLEDIEVESPLPEDPEDVTIDAKTNGDPSLDITEQ